MKKILITGFDPFGGATVNPSYLAVQHLPEQIGDGRLYKLELPTEFQRSFEVLKQALEEIQPEIVICVGQAGGNQHIAVERVAVNWMDARIPDNAGAQPVDEKIEEDGADAYFATLPTRAICDALEKAEIPARLSYTAGCFVCNRILYGLLHYAVSKGLQLKGGFIHVPYIPEQLEGKQEGLASMELDMIVKALEIVIEKSLQA